MSRPVSQTLESSKALATTAGYARSVTVTLKETVTAMRYIWLFDNAAAAAGVLLDTPTPVAPGEKIVIDFEPTLLTYTNGLYAALSTSADTFAAPVANNEARFGADVAPTGAVQTNSATRMNS